MFSTPIFITNFKNYEAATGAKAIHMAKVHEEVAKELGVNIAVAVAAPDIYRVSQAVSIPVLAQHIDPIDYGNFTGGILPQGVKNSGAVGTLLNHSEKRLEEDNLSASVACAQKSSLVRVVCAENPEEVEKLSELDPDFLAFEPPELIGAPGKISVATEQPTSIAESVKMARGIPVLVGAGVCSAKDIEVSLKLGAKGFLVASAVIKSSNPEKKLREMVGVMR